MPQEQKLSILIVDDRLLVREGLKQILRHEYVDVVFGEARSAEEALARIKTHAWRLAILDVSHPDANGLFVLAEICSRRPQISVLMLGTPADSKHGIRALQLGAAGYISKNLSRAELLKAVRNILEGKKHFSESILRGVDRPKPAGVHPELSAQEYRVLLAIAAGRRTSEIAAELNLSDKTVSTYKRRGFNKLGFKSTAELVRYVIDRKLS